MKKAEVIQKILGDRVLPDDASGASFAPANIALCKYWGKRDPEINLPVNGSLSISLHDKGTQVNITPAEFDGLSINDEMLAADDPKHVRMFDFIDLFRQDSAPTLHIATQSNIPIAAGLASSASAFAAVVMALDRAGGWDLFARQLSILARMGSGSACRSIYHGFVEWHPGSQGHGMDCFAELLPEQWPEFRVGLLALSTAAKKVGSREGMNRTVRESVLYQSWPAVADQDLGEIRAAIQARDFPRLGMAAESNACSMHATMLGCRPPLLYWLPETVETLHRVWGLRDEGVSVYATMDAGPNVKLLFLEEEASAVQEAFPEMEVTRPFAPLGT
ncbi:MAG: diphosphomevalonate decarboxylase [Kiritimatiellia bacterium]